jgi:glycosyltransferase involved in cell wall biosynthesis
MTGHDPELMGNPTISVIIPVYNGEAFLPQAITSVRGQDYSPLEIIVIDDGSTDGTPDLVKDLGGDIRYIYQEHRGPAAARNTGIKTANGELIAFLDVDDLWPPDKLASQVPYLVADDDLQVVLGRTQIVFLPGAERKAFRFESPDNDIMGIFLGCGLYRRSAFTKVGLFDESLRYAEDHDWFFRARECGLVMRSLKKITLIYRLHPGNMTLGKKMEEMGFLRVLKRSLERRRSEGHSQAKPMSDWLDDADRV